MSGAGTIDPILQFAANHVQVTTFGWTTVPITVPPAATFDPTMFRPAAEMRSAINYYESSLSNDPVYSSMDAIASSAGLSSNPLDLASDMIAAYPTTPAWVNEIPAALQTYVLSVASAEQSLYIDDPQPTGDASYDTGALSSIAEMMAAVRSYEAGITQGSDYPSWADIAATATGLDNIDPSRDPLSLAKALETGPTPTWYTQMPAPLQTFVQSIVQEEAKIYDQAPAASGADDSGSPSLTNGSGRLTVYSASVVAASFFIFIIAL